MEGLDVVTLHQRLVKQFPVGRIGKHFLVKEWLIRRKIIERMCEPARVDITLLLHINDATLLDRGDGFQSVLLSI